MQTDSAYTPVSADDFQAVLNSLQMAPKSADGRFNGTKIEQEGLAAQLRILADDDPGDKPTILIKRDDLIGLSRDLRDAQPRFSPGQYAAELATLISPEDV